jgi:hypothetical protein
MLTARELTHLSHGDPPADAGGSRVEQRWSQPELVKVFAAPEVFPGMWAFTPSDGRSLLCEDGTMQHNHGAGTELRSYLVLTRGLVPKEGGLRIVECNLPLIERGNFQANNEVPVTLLVKGPQLESGADTKSKEYLEALDNSGLTSGIIVQGPSDLLGYLVIFRFDPNTHQPTFSLNRPPTLNTANPKAEEDSFASFDESIQPTNGIGNIRRVVLADKWNGSYYDTANQLDVMEKTNQALLGKIQAEDMFFEECIANAVGDRDIAIYRLVEELSREKIALCGKETKTQQAMNKFMEICNEEASHDQLINETFDNMLILYVCHQGIFADNTGKPQRRKALVYLASTLFTQLRKQIQEATSDYKIKPLLQTCIEERFKFIVDNASKMRNGFNILPQHATAEMLVSSCQLFPEELFCQIIQEIQDLDNLTS